MAFKNILPTPTEQRDFTNPRVRFRRIGGRIIPMFNKKRIGGELSSAGAATSTIGVAALGVGAVKSAIGRTRAAKAVSMFSVTPLKWLSNARNAVAPSKEMTGLAKIVAKTGYAPAKAVRLAIRHPGKFGLLTLGAGIGMTMLGTDIELEDPTGKDF